MERNKRMKKIKAGKYGYYFSNNVHANEYEWINASIENNRNTCKIKTVNSSLTNCREMVIKLNKDMVDELINKLVDIHIEMEKDNE